MTSSKTTIPTPQENKSMLRAARKLFNMGTSKGVKAIITKEFTFDEPTLPKAYSHLVNSYLDVLCNIVGYVREELEVLEDNEIAVLYWDSLPISR